MRNINVTVVGGSASGGSGTTGSVPIQFPMGTVTSRSGTITTGGAAQVLAAANTTRTGFSIQNNSSGDLWFNTLATAVVGQPSIKISSGALYESPASCRDGGAISIIGATTAQAFSGREW